MVGRTAFGGDLLYSVAVSGFIYPIFGHWVWGPGGWLENSNGMIFKHIGGGVFFSSITTRIWPPTRNVIAAPKVKDAAIR